MKRKIKYAGMILVIAGLAAWFVVPQGKGTEEKAYLGDEVVYFNATAAQETENDTDEIKKADSEKESGKTTAAAEEKEQKERAAENSQEQTYEKIQYTGKIKTYNDTGTVVAGNAGFELYNYVPTMASRYTKAINRITKSVDESVNVYALVAPTSVGITFPDNKMDKINSSNQQESIEKIKQQLSGREHFVDLYDTMMKHRTEYIYFRTDHHWTSLGAYYAYTAFCEEKGVQANPIENYEKKDFGGFLGTYYRDAKKDKALEKDVVEAYIPLSKNISMEYTTVSGTKIKADVIADASSYGETSKYCAFIAGDNPYTVIKNKEIQDGSSCVVVKESYGNALVPYLADHYETIYVVDYRYWEGKLTDFVKKKKTRDILFVNNISMTRNGYLIGKMSQIAS